MPATTSLTCRAVPRGNSPRRWRTSASRPSRWRCQTCTDQFKARGAEVAGTQIHSVSLPSFVVTNEVVFGGPGERLIIRHDPGLVPAPYSLLFGEHS